MRLPWSARPDPIPRARCRREAGEGRHGGGAGDLGDRDRTEAAAERGGRRRPPGAARGEAVLPWDLRGPVDLPFPDFQPSESRRLGSSHFKPPDRGDLFTAAPRNCYTSRGMVPCRFSPDRAHQRKINQPGNEPHASCLCDRGSQISRGVAPIKHGGPGRLSAMLCFSSASSAAFRAVYGLI